MNRLHIHLKTSNLPQSIQYYQALFGRAPDVDKPDYAKWMLDDPHANISLSSHAARDGSAFPTGVDHVGVEFDNAPAMHAANQRLTAAENTTREEAAAQCCYARSDKYWATSPEGAIWELFHTHGALDRYGAEPDRAALRQAPSSKPR